MEKSSNQTVGLAIFDVEKLRQGAGQTLFRVSDILHYFERRGEGELISQEVKKWVPNCDKYVLMGKAHKSALLRWVPFNELRASGFLSEKFFKAYTLAKYRQWIRGAETFIEAEGFCRKIVGFGMILAGPEVKILSPLVQLILNQDPQFWGFGVNTSDEVVRKRVHELIGEAMMGDISRLKISGD